MTSADPRIERLTSPRVPLLIMGLALLLFTWKLWANDLWAPDEPYFAEGAREMLADGQWLVPHINGDLDNHKPPFFFWLIAGLGWLLGGITPLVARLPSVLAGLGSVWLTMKLGERSDIATGRLAAMMLVTMFMFWDKARWAQTDSVLCFFIVCALSLFDLLYRERVDTVSAGGRNRQALGVAVAFWVSIALAFLTKGPIGLVLPIGIIGVVVLWDRRPLALLRLQPAIGLLILLASVGTWAYFATTRVEGYDALASVKEHFFDRARQGMHHPQPFWYYAEVWSYSLLPWSFLFPGMLIFGWRSRDQPTTRFAFAWVVFTFLLFSFSTEKRDLYILPALPAIALLMASWLVQQCRSPETLRLHPHWARIGFYVVATVFGIAAVALPFVARAIEPHAFWPACGTALLLLLSALAIGWSLRRTLTTTLATVVVVGSVTMLGFVTFLYPTMEVSKSVKPLAAVISAELGAAGKQPRTGAVAQRALVGFDLANITRLVNFHTNGLYIEIAPTAHAAVELLEAAQYQLLLANEETLRQDLSLDQWRALDVILKTRISRRNLVLVRSP